MLSHILPGKLRTKEKSEQNILTIVYAFQPSSSKNPLSVFSALMVEIF
jgi:hypothetical protein